MLAPFFNLTMLAFESQQVVGLRLMKLAFGGPAAHTEMNHMVAEKIAAANRATGRLMMGASPDSVVRGYRKTVKANARRLLK